MPRAYRKPITRVIELEGVALVVTLSDRSLSAREKYRHKGRYSHSLASLFGSAIRDAKVRRARRAGPLPQLEADLRVPRPS